MKTQDILDNMVGAAIGAFAGVYTSKRIVNNVTEIEKIVAGFIGMIVGIQVQKAFYGGKGSLADVQIHDGPRIQGTRVTGGPVNKLKGKNGNVE